MKWNKYRMKTTTEAVDLISYTLGEMGIEGIEIEDKIPLSDEDKKKMFIDILPDLGEDDGVAYVSFYIEPEKDHAETLQEVTEAVKELADFVDIGEASIEKSETADVDWMNNWKKFWKPFKVDDKIIIKPTWEKLPEDTTEDTLVVELDPGTAFGTGMHHTTRLCITQMKKYLQKGQKLFDVGCGSGILSIISLLLGADSAFAVDIDPNAVDIAYQNAGMNDVDISKYTVKAGDIITNTELQNEIAKNEYDVVVANIVADVIIALAPKAREYMKQGGVFITSGIIEDRVDDVKAALEKCGFEINSIKQRKDWVSIVCK